MSKTTKQPDNVIRARYASSTYVARWRGRQATCTESLRGAAEAVAHKVLGKDKLFLLVELQGDDSTVQTYRVEDNVTDQAFAAVAALRPDVAHRADPERFWTMFHKRYPHITRAQMEQMLLECEDADSKEGGTDEG